MIINNLRNLLDERNITAYALSKMAGISSGNVKEIVDDETVVPRYRALNAICHALKVNIDDVLKYEPNRVNTRSNKSMNKSRLSQNYFTNKDYNILDVQERLREQQEQMMVY